MSVFAEKLRLNLLPEPKWKPLGRLRDSFVDGLRERPGQLTMSDVLDLLETGGYDDGVTYLVAKGLDGKPLKQKALFEDLVDREMNPEQTPGVNKALLKHLVNEGNFSPDSTFDGRKFRNSQAPHIWQDSYDALARDVAARGATTYFVAYLSLGEFSTFVSAFKESPQATGKIRILLPSGIRGQQETLGYDIDLSRDKGERVQTLPYDFGVKANSVLVDDTLATRGHALPEVQDFLDPRAFAPVQTLSFQDFRR